MVATAKIPTPTSATAFSWLRQLRRNYSIIPLVAFAGVGVTMAVGIMAHALQAPDVEINRENNPEPWKKYEHKQYRLLNPAHHDYASIEAPPKY